MTATVSADDEGKTVVDANGEQLGTVERVTDDTAFVRPENGVPPVVERALGWSNDDAPYPLPVDAVDSISDSTVRLRPNL